MFQPYLSPVFKLSEEFCEILLSSLKSYLNLRCFARIVKLTSLEGVACMGQGADPCQIIYVHRFLMIDVTINLIATRCQVL